MPTSLTYFGFVPGYALFWGLFALGLGMFSFRVTQLLRFMFLGQKESSARSWRKWLGDTFFRVLSQLCQLKNFRRADRAPLGHAFLAWGFFAFTVSYFFFIILQDGLGLTAIQHTAFFFYYSWILDFMALLIFLAAGWGLLRRFVIRPERLRGAQSLEAFIILMSVFTHPVTHVFKEAADIAAGLPPAGLPHSVLPPLSSWFSNLFTGMASPSIQNFSVAFFWAHWLTAILVLIYIPWSNYLHVFSAVFNGVLRPQSPGDALKPLDLESTGSFGISRINDLTWKQNLDLYSCVVCGNCQEICPAYVTGKPLNPKKLIQDLKRQLLRAGPALVRAKSAGVELSTVAANTDIPGNVVTGDEIWACTTCGACDEICPVWVQHIDKVVDLRRNMVLERSTMPETAESALRNIESRGHPWRGTTLTRTDWAAGLDVGLMADNTRVDYLFWVGCTEALEDRSVKVARSLAILMKQVGLSFGILGSEESCCGDPARRLGNEYLFQEFAKSNIEIIKKYGVKKIVTGCPHCYNTLKNEYPHFGGRFEVIHHTELLAGLVRDGRLMLPDKPGVTVTYHDACYLGRYNGIYQPPRNILRRLVGSKLVEMSNSGRRSFCCGGGGGQMWLEERGGQRVSENRLDQVLETGAHLVATACPYCLQMLEDAAKTRQQESPEVKDIAELLAESVAAVVENRANGS